jgi:Acyl-CoA dehydrogenase, middle domain
MGIRMVAHAIIAFGTEMQKDYFLPGILTGEVFSCQGYSEPEAASDLAPLSMAAVDDGDDPVCTRSKIWTTPAGEANWMFALVRTTKAPKKQQGITFVLIDMTSPGIGIRPLVMTSGEKIQNQVFFDEVHVPQSNVLGKIDDGWTVAKYLLEFERGGGRCSTNRVSRTGWRTRGSAPRCSRYWSTECWRRSPKARTPARPRHGGGHARGARDRTEPNTDRTGDGGRGSARTGLPTACGVARRTGVRIRAAGRRIRRRAAVAGGCPLRYCNDRAGSIYAGSNEIQRNILAKAALAENGLQLEQRTRTAARRARQVSVNALRPREEPRRGQDRRRLATRHLAQVRRRTRHSGEPRCPKR